MKDINREPTDEDYKWATKDWDINRELAELLGMFVGEYKLSTPNIPDFTTDSGKIELLRLMMKRDDWPKFAHYVGTHNGAFPLDLITDTTGLLAQAAVEWLRKER